MNDDLVNGWDELKDTLPYDHAVAADLLFDYGDKLADHITALTAERDALRAALDAAEADKQLAVIAALAAQRERDAKVAEARADEKDSYGPDFDAGWEAAALVIAAAIRAQGGK